MKVSLKSVIFSGIFSIAFPAIGICQPISDDIREQVDAVVMDVYQEATAKFPCKVKTGGKPRMLRWQSVDKCLNEAHDLIDWEAVSDRLRAIRAKSDAEPLDFMSAVEASLTAHAVTYDKVFEVKDEKALLPLSNSVLKFLPPESLLDLPVTDRASRKIGTFSGVYTFEKVGEISGARQRHSLFQYTDENGKMQSSTDRLLLDSFGVPWSEAIKQAGFRLPADKISLRASSGAREAISPDVPRKSSPQ